MSAGKRTILLIGSTGHGKSTLGNFFLDPSERHITKQQTFQIARGIAPETQFVKVATKKDIQIIDTPGLNESAKKDFEHMIEIVKTLEDNESGAISACILCIRFESKLDAQYKATIAYYKSLLPVLFEENVLIVLTNFQDHRRAQRDRDIRNIRVDDVVDVTASEVKACAGLPYKPQVFKIDSIPLDDDDRQRSEETRLAILDYIQQVMNPIRIHELKVAKTDALKQIDAKEIEGLDGEIRGYKGRLVQVKKGSENALSQIEKKEREKSKYDREILRMKAELEDKDSTGAAISAEWSLKQGWKFLERQSLGFEVKSPWTVVEHVKWDNGHLEWKEFKWTANGAHGKVEGKFMRGLYANVTLKTQKRYKYAEQILSLKEKIDATQQIASSVKADLEKDEEVHREYSEEILVLQNYIKDRNELKNALSSDYMSVEDATIRLKDIGN